MALPANIDPASPAGTDQVSSGDDQIRAFKQFLVDILGLPTNPTNVTAALMDANADGTIASSLSMALKPVANVFTQNQTVQSLFPQFIAETTGQASKARILEVDSKLFISWNAYKDASGWQRDDTAFSSWLFGMGAGGGDLISALHSPAGTGLITFANVFAFDSAGNMTQGVVPLARIASVVSQSTATLTNTFALGSLPVGTFIHLVCRGASIMPGSVGNPHQYFNLISAGTAIFKTQGDHSQNVSPSLTYKLNISSIIEVTATSSISVQAILSQGTGISNTITAMIYKP